MNLRLIDIEKNYQDVSVLKKISLEIPTGSTTAILGPSGSGKTTLLSIMSGLESPSQGEVWIGQQRIDELADTKLSQYRAKHFGFVFQNFSLLPHLTALENVSLPLEINRQPNYEKRARETLESLGLGQRFEHFPSQLSGGEQQRVAIARAVIHQPDIVFADEPTGNLDSKTGFEILKILLSQKGRTVVLVTHNEDLTRDFDKIIRITDGQIA